MSCSFNIFSAAAKLRIMLIQCHVPQDILYVFNAIHNHGTGLRNTKTKMPLPSNRNNNTKFSFLDKMAKMNTGLDLTALTYLRSDTLKP